MTTPTPQELRLRAALHSIRNEVRGLLGAFERELIDATSVTNVRVLQRKLADADAALAAAPSAGAGAQEAVPGSDVLCESCARVFCPHEDRLHFDKDGCPSCEELDGPAPPPPPPDTLVEAMTESANRLAVWIDAAPLKPDQLHDVYDAHVLLCEAIRALARLRAPTPTGETR